jgi:hypothetical protein
MPNGPQNPELPHPRDEIEVINERGAEAARRAAQLLCRETIEVAYDTVGVHLQADKEQHGRVIDEGFPAGAVVGYFVLQDRFTAPRKEGEFVRTFSTRIEPGEGANQHDYIKLHVPVGENRIQNYEMPQQDEIGEIYAEIHEDEDTHWYAIGTDGLFEYIPDLRQADGDEVVLTDQGIWQWLDERIPENVETIASIFRKVINWETVAQRIDRIGDR